MSTPVPPRRAAARAEPCPICRKPADPAFTPFCSARCADVDLGRWLTDRYAIPTAEDEDEDAEGLGRGVGEGLEDRPRQGRATPARDPD